VGFDLALGKRARREDRAQRINRLARKLGERHLRQRFSIGIGSKKKPFARRGRRLKRTRMIAYDLETTPIKKGTPSPNYITAFGSRCKDTPLTPDWSLSMPVRDFTHLLEIVETHFLIEDFEKCRFVAWNGNNFDVFFIAAALLHSKRFTLRPYLTRNKALRGLRVTLKFDKNIWWEFLDGISMTIGNAPMTLKKFVGVFAPEFPKLEGPDFEAGEVFNALNPLHVKYAERDSEGLWWAMKRAEDIVVEHFNIGLQPTVGNMGIKVFTSNLPEDVTVWEPGYHAQKVLRDFVMRGGYCFCARKYEGPIWKYDINQAYAAAMRDARLPSGRCIHTKVWHAHAETGIYRITARNPRNKIPFYYRDLEGVSAFGLNEITQTWLTTLEINQLKVERWQVEIHEGYFWDESFMMREYVDKLEALRTNAPGGPSGAQGTMIKSIGNNSYGKTVEQLDGLELVMSAEQPEGFFPYQSEDEALQHIWFKFGQPILREYHQPQLGCFITAHVRMVVRRAILLNPRAWLYADTDCVVFSEPVTLPLDPKKYGLWKEEVAGEAYRLITKKVYASVATEIVKVGGVDMERPKTAHAKGINVRRLSAAEFESWYLGSPPTQTQNQRNNFLKVMTGFEMFAERVKVGQVIDLKLAA
jgi:hypothetical protein